MALKRNGTALSTDSHQVTLRVELPGPIQNLLRLRPHPAYQSFPKRTCEVGGICSERGLKPLARSEFAGANSERAFAAIERGLIHGLRFTHAHAELRRASVACWRTVRTGQGA